MPLETFVRERQADWQRLEALTQQAGGNGERLSAGDLYELGRLYRAVTSDLALAQRDFPNQRVTVYLNQLVARCHALLYRKEPLAWSQMRTFFTHTFPQLYRHIAPYTLAAFLIFLLPGLAAWLLVWQDPALIYLFLGDTPSTRSLVGTVEQGELWTDIAPAMRSGASAMILTNNIQVTFYAFAGSMTAGLFTLWIMVLNGTHIGAIFGLLQAHGLAGGLGEFVLAHGPVELSVIFVAGGCGLYVGDGLIRPGLLSRREALTRRAKDAVLIILGCAPLLIFSGLIEGFISPSGLHWTVKALVGLVTGVALHGYWGRR
jgi:uncharacterized membrane protein SpoIIM required for sporulation